ncbi:MAG: DinB family protein [Bacilli bacterium]
MLTRPVSSEYNPYFDRYINLVPEGDIRETLMHQRCGTVELLASISEKSSLYRYDSDKWTIKEVMGHISDTERVMAYRLLCASRGDTSVLPGFDQDIWVRETDFNRISFDQILSDFRMVRDATLSLTRTLSEGAWLRRSTVGAYTTSVLALAYIIAGHELHHRTILQERYLSHIS